MTSLLTVAPPREIDMFPDSTWPVLLYTDASDIPHRPVGQYIVGGVLIHPDILRPEFFTYVVLIEVVQKWIPKKTQIGQLEIFAGPVALDTWSELLQNKKVIHFIDNDAASASLIKGYSPTVDSCELVGEYWIRAAALRMSVYIDRVESKSNIADAPSRNSAPTQLASAKKVPPMLKFLQDGVASRVAEWFQGQSQFPLRGAGTCPVDGGQPAPSPNFQ